MYYLVKVKLAQQNRMIDSKDIVYLGFMLDINESVESVYRKELLYSMFNQEQWEVTFKNRKIYF